MGRLLSTFTFDRNSVRKTASESSQAALKTLMLAKQGQIDKNDKTASNVAAALGSYLGILAKGDEDKYRATRLGTAFEDLAAKNPVDAWQWLMSRSLWRFTIPNGTRSPINNEAKGVNATFCFFQTIVELLARLQGERGTARFLFYDELCQILVDDDNWSKETGELYLQIRENRKKTFPKLEDRQGFLEELEETYKIPRDNFNTIFGKCFKQTGLFEYIKNGVKEVGISFKEPLSPVEQGRIRFMIDNPSIWRSEDWPTFMDLQKIDFPLVVNETQNELVAPAFDGDLGDLSALASEFTAAVARSGLRLPSIQIKRFLASVLAKRLVIFTGLSGSGKTKLAQALCHWIGKSSDDHEYTIIAVGPNWTSNEHILGYPDSLDSERYVSTPFLDVVQMATASPDRPFFIILDEMNLSHVERYFADVLSSIESSEAMVLHDSVEPKSNVPSRLSLPHNLFIIGTINVDETTYMFSPKVLDRANVLEFALTSDQIMEYIKTFQDVKLADIAGQGAGFGETLVQRCKSDAKLNGDELSKFSAELNLFFNFMESHSAQFGFRVISEMKRFIHFYRELGTSSDNFREAFDCQILQKLLPKLSGSRKKLEPILSGLGALCLEPRTWETEEEAGLILQNAQSILTRAMAWSELRDAQMHPLAKDSSGKNVYAIESATYPQSFEKIQRMLKHLSQNGFTSFAES